MVIPSGIWKTPQGATLQISIAEDGTLSGHYHTPLGHADDVPYPLQGVWLGALLAFSVAWRGQASLTTWNARHVVLPDGTHTLQAQWLLSRLYEDAAQQKPTEPWNTFLVNSTIFTLANEA